MPIETSKGVRVKQSAAIDYTKLPIADDRIPLQIVGGEALAICERGLADRAKAIEKRKKLLAKIRRAVKPPRGVMPAGTQIELNERSPNSVTVRITFKIPKRGMGDETAAKIQKAYKDFVESAPALKLNSGPWSSGGLGVRYCKVAFNTREEKGKALKKLVGESLQPMPDSRSLGAKLLTDQSGRYDFLRWSVRSKKPSRGPGIRMAEPVVHNEGKRWFILLPANEDNPPAEIFLPRGTFKRLTMSQYWKLLEKAGLED